MSKINESIVSVTIDGDTIALRCNLRNVQTVNARFGGLTPLQQAFGRQDMDAIAFTLMECGGLRAEEKRAFPQRLFRNGITNDLLLELYKFSYMLYNGGRLPPEPGDEEPAEETPEGNG
ncbi:MAG: hypothetical protein AB7F35_06375 [Acetobacteraceae bacterium]